MAILSSSLIYNTEIITEQFFKAKKLIEIDQKSTENSPVQFSLNLPAFEVGLQVLYS